jgi:glycosidase
MKTVSMMSASVLCLGLAGLSACGQAPANGQGAEAQQVETTEVARPDRPIEDEIIYFVMPDRFENGDVSNDRGGFEGGRLKDGYDPTDFGFFHGGDLKGLTDRLDYIQGMGVTAIWLTPIFKNNPVQGGPGQESSGYHGYWITDFTSVDPHIGTEAEFKAFVEAAHARDMKVYMDIITNHTADIISYRECYDPEWTGETVEGCPYRYIGDYPWTTKGGPDGAPINEGFLGDDAVHQTAENFAKLKDLGWAYTPFIPEGLENIKTPAWLNDPIYYHNRGETDWIDEDSLYGDFAGLDDLNTAHPRVVAGMIDIYKDWITRYKVDGYRIDTVKHVNDEFWQQFAPAIMDHAKSEGIDHFHMFAEAYEPDAGQLARFTTTAKIPTALDFAFQSATQAFVIDGGTGLDMDRLYKLDQVYAGGVATGRQLPTFLGNHDMGRFSGFIRAADPDISDEDMIKKLRIANALMFFGRGVPTIYYGDEQGFVSDGGDRLARENMFPSQTAVYNDNDLIGTDSTTAEDNFDTSHPLYQMTAEYAAIRSSERALRFGEQVTRISDRDESIFAFSRIDYESGTEIVVALNAEDSAQDLNVVVDGRAEAFTSLVGDCAGEVSAPGSYRMQVPALGVLVCKTEFGTE